MKFYRPASPSVNSARSVDWVEHAIVEPFLVEVETCSMFNQGYLVELTEIVKQPVVIFPELALVHLRTARLAMRVARADGACLQAWQERPRGFLESRFLLRAGAAQTGACG